MSSNSKFEKQFMDRGGHYNFRLHDASTPPVDHLPAAVYEIVVESNPITGIEIRWNKVSATFTVPEKRFGHHNRHMERIKDDYDRHNPSLGVLLAGLKGSGKSMFAEDLGNWMIGGGLPVIMISQPLGPDMLRHIIAATGPCMVYFDEFGKFYDEGERARLLPLFSDSTLTGVLFVVTGNEKKEFPDMIYDRPGRFRYRLTFSDLRTDAALEVGEHFQLTPAQIAGLTRYVSTHNISWDMLCSVAKMIRPCKSDKEIYDFLEIMNVPRWGRVEPQVLTIYKDGTPVFIRPETVRWDTTTLTARGCLKGDIDNLFDIELPLVETVDYYKNHENGGDAVLTETFGEYEITYKFKIINNFTPKLGASYTGEYKFDNHYSEIMDQRAKAANAANLESGEGEDTVGVDVTGDRLRA